MNKTSASAAPGNSTQAMFASAPPASAIPVNGSAAHLDIPPALPTPAPVAAPRPGRNAAKQHAVPSADAAPRTRTARSRRVSLSSTRAPSAKSRGKAVVRDDGHAAPAAEADHSALAPVPRETEVRIGGNMTAEQRGCAPVVTARTVAAPDDAHGKIAAVTASTDADRAGQPPDGCAFSREACADMALARPLNLTHSNPTEDDMPKSSPQLSDENAARAVDALKTSTDPEALVDGPAYVRAVAQHVDLVAASARLVVSTDEKVSKAELDRLRELIFGKGGPPPADETLRIDWTGIPRPERELRGFQDSQGGDRDHN